MPTHDPAIVHTEPADISELVAVIWDAIADAEGEEAPVIAVLADRQRGQRNVVEHGGNETETEGRLPGRRWQGFDRHHRGGHFYERQIVSAGKNVW